MKVRILYLQLFLYIVANVTMQELGKLSLATYNLLVFLAIYGLFEFCFLFLEMKNNNAG